MISFDRPRCGDIWMCNLCQNGKSVQSGYRPVFIVSNNMNNEHSPILNVIPLTSRQKKKLPVHVELSNYEEYGLQAKSTMLIEQITTISIDDIDRYVGTIRDESVFNDIYRAMSIQFPFFTLKNNANHN